MPVLYYQHDMIAKKTTKLESFPTTGLEEFHSRNFMEVKQNIKDNDAKPSCQYGEIKKM